MLVAERWHSHGLRLRRNRVCCPLPIDLTSLFILVAPKAGCFTEAGLPSCTTRFFTRLQHFPPSTCTEPRGGRGICGCQVPASMSPGDCLNRKSLPRDLRFWRISCRHQQHDILQTCSTELAVGNDCIAEVFRPPTLF